MSGFRFTGLLCIALMLAIPAWAAPEVDQPAPPLRGKLFSGQPFDLRQMRGKVVLVNFYSSYCKFCAYEIGNLEAFYEGHKDRGFEIIVIGIDPPEDRHRVERMVGVYGLRGMMTADLEESGFDKAYRTPTAFVVDRSGIVRSRTWGSKTPRYFAEYVLPLLDEPVR